MKLTYPKNPKALALAGVFTLMAGLTAHAEYPPAVLSDGPVTYHRFNETGQVSMPNPQAANAGTLGAAINGADYTSDLSGPGITKGMAGALADPANTAYSFPGVYDTAVIVPYNSVLAPAGPFTVEFWTKPATTVVGTPTGFYNYTPSPRAGWMVYQGGDAALTSGNGWTFRLYKDTSTYSGNVSVPMTINTNLWYHLVAVYDGTKVMLYTNGVLAGQSTTTGYTAPPSTRRLAIGTRGPSGTSTYPYKGLIDEYAFYTNVLSAADVAAHYAAATTNGTGYAAQVLDLNPAGYWRMNEQLILTGTPNLGTGGSALDGTYRYNSATTPELQSSCAMGETNQALVLGTDSPGYVSVPALSTSMTSATFECWLKRNGTQSNSAGIIMHRNGNATHGLCFQTDGLQLAYNWNNATAARNWNSGLVPPDGQWTYVALAVTSSQATMYMYDGTSWSSATNTMSHGAASFNALTLIGNDSYNANRHYNGLLDEAAVYNKALTAGQLRTHALAGFCDMNKPAFLTDPPVLLTVGTIYAGWPFSLNVDAYGTAPLSFQWRKDGINIPNATNTTYSVAVAGGSDSGNYDVVVTNPNGSTTNATTTTVTVVTTSPDVATGLRTWLKFDETTGLTARDGSGNNRDGVLQSFAGDDSQWVPGLISNALSVNPDFYAEQQVVLVPNTDGAFDFSSNLEFTLSAWVYGNPASQGANGGIITRGYGLGGEQFSMDVDGGHFRFFVRNASSTPTIITTSIAPNGAWQHVCAVYKAADGLMKLYVNGVQAGSATPPTSLLVTNHDLSIGARQQYNYDGAPYDYTWVGLVDDARVYGRALVAAEVQALYSAAPTIAPSIIQDPAGRSVFAGGSVTLNAVAAGTLPLKYQWYKGGTAVAGATASTLTLASVTSANIGDYSLWVTNGAGYTNSAVATVALLPMSADTYESVVVADAPEAYWRLNETSGTVLDSMGRHDGSASGNVFFSQAGALAGNADTCAYFDKAGQSLVTVPYSSNLNAVSFTIECWAQYAGPSPMGAYYSPVASADTGCKGYLLYATTAGAWECWLGRGTTWTYSQGAPVVASAWAHLVETFDGTTAKMYVNGVLTHSTTVASFIPNSTRPLFIGCNLPYGDTYFTGYIDEVACYKSVLPPERINAHYTLGVYGASGLPVFVSPPVSQTVEVGTTATFTATVAGAPTLSYQWKKDGVDIPGATGLTLNVPNVYYTDGGHQYTLAATNGIGGSVSLPATLTVMPPASQTNLVLQTKAGTSGSGVVLELVWPSGTLFSAPAVTGPWKLVTDATLPYYTVSPTNEAMFFRCE